jgi:hypothetical protein
MATASRSSLLVLVSNSAILPGSLEPQPATILVNVDSGKIVQVRQGHIAAKDEYQELLTKGDILEWIEVPEGQVVLPGLVEWAETLGYARTTSHFFFACAAHMSISMSLVGHHGKALRLALKRPSQVA